LLENSVLDAGVLGKSELDAAVTCALSRARPNLLVSWFWTRLLPESWLTRCPNGGIGVHPSLLPRHRGPNPYFWAIDAGDETTGVTLHTLSLEYDRGAILSQQSVRIEERNAWQLARTLDRPSLELLREGVFAVARGSQPAGTSQDEAAATWAPDPCDDQLRVDWHWPSERILRRIRALAPVPGLALEVKGTAFFVVAARQSHRTIAALEPGEAGILVNPAALVIRTADGTITVERATMEEPDGSAEPKRLDGRELAKLIESRWAERHER
jgi:methionyl-tRNA formyltransferase